MNFKKQLKISKKSFFNFFGSKKSFSRFLKKLPANMDDFFKRLNYEYIVFFFNKSIDKDEPNPDSSLPRKLKSWLDKLNISSLVEKINGGKIKAKLIPGVKNISGSDLVPSSRLEKLIGDYAPTRHNTNDDVLCFSSVNEDNKIIFNKEENTMEFVNKDLSVVSKLDLLLREKFKEIPDSNYWGIANASQVAEVLFVSLYVANKE